MNETNTWNDVQYINTIFNNPNYLFWFLFVIIFSIPAFICFLLNFYHFIKNNHILIYKNLHHHSILFLLINDFLQIILCQPITLMYFYFGHVKYFYSTLFCMFWIYVEYTFVTQSLILTMYVSIERYMLLFYKPIILKHQILFHYIPLFISSFYLPSILIYLIFFFPCKQIFDYTKFECGIPCFVHSYSIGLFNEIFHIFIPALIILIFNTFIIIRVLLHKIHAHVINNLWRQNRRMILQLVMISLLTSVAWIPYVIVIIIQIFINPTFGSTILFFHVINITYVPCLGTPYLALVALPQDIRKKIFSCVWKIKTNRRIYPNPTLQRATIN